ncbi:MAG: ATP-grasp domain-containing protein [Proteobacteria bacterium]|nr:ATP-grasp domain-containing protein [Pseudomonadota bacterium]
MTRILVHEWVSAGALADEPALAVELMPMGAAMRAALAADFAALPGVQLSVAACADAPWSGPAAALQAAPGEAPLAALARWAAQHDAVCAVAPESDGLLLAAHAAVAPHARWLGCAPAAISLATSKSRTLAALHAAGIATPLRADVSAAASHVVRKPDDGAGSVATQRLAERPAPAPGFTIEPWVEGVPMSLGLWVTAGRAELLAVNAQQIELAGDGQVHYLGLAAAPLDAHLAPLAQAVADAMPGLAGYVGVDYVASPAFGPVVIEVNPRVTCGYVGLSARLGHNLAGRWL